LKLLTLARDLRRRRSRERQQLFVAEGVRAVEELLASPLAVRGLLVAPQLAGAHRGAALLDSAGRRGVDLTHVDEREFASAAETDSPQGVLAIAETPVRRLEDIELAVMETVDEKAKALSDARAQLEAVEAKIAEASAARDTALAGLDGEKAAAAAERDALAGRLPADLLALYEKQRARYGVGASHLRGGVSSASGVALNSSDMTVVRAAAPDDVLLCPDSNAILVRTNESGL